MTARRWYTLFCDSCDSCEFTAESDSATKTRAKAAEYGWTYSAEVRPRGGPARSVDTCGECAGREEPAHVKALRARAAL